MLQKLGLLSEIPQAEFLHTSHTKVREQFSKFVTQAPYKVFVTAKIPTWGNQHFFDTAPDIKSLNNQNRTTNSRAALVRQGPIVRSYIHPNTVVTTLMLIRSTLHAVSALKLSMT